MATNSEWLRRLSSVECMAGPRRACALLAASAKPRVERLQQLGVHLRQLDVPERRPDVRLDLGPVAVDGAFLDVGDLEPPVDQHAERRLGPGLPALVDLAQQLDPHALRLGPRLGGSLQGVPTVGQWVHARVHTHPEAAARELVDGGALPSSPPRHDPSPVSR
jgi:hypothetical protein